MSARGASAAGPFASTNNVGPAVQGGYGQCVRFWGNQCRHYTTENTSDVTRVSLDLRVIPEALFRSAHASPTGTVPFTLHRYYFTTA